MKRLFTLILFASIFTTFSCIHEDPEYTVKVTVMLEGTKSPVPSATVIFPAISNSTKDTTKIRVTTDNAGKASYTFKLPAILEAQAYSPDFSKTGTAMIRLEENEIVEKTIYIK